MVQEHVQSIVREATLEDHEILVEFNCSMALETENKTLTAEFISKGVQAVLSNPEKGTYFVFEREGQIIGALMITLEWSDWRNGFFWWIQSVYFKPEFRRQGFFRELYKAVRQLAFERPDVCGLRLYVDRHNRTAMLTYQALGMVETDYRLYEEEFNR